MASLNWSLATESNARHKWESFTAPSLTGFAAAQLPQSKVRSSSQTQQQVAWRSSCKVPSWHTERVREGNAFLAAPAAAQLTPSSEAKPLGFNGRVSVAHHSPRAFGISRCTQPLSLFCQARCSEEQRLCSGLPVMQNTPHAKMGAEAS